MIAAFPSGMYVVVMDVRLKPGVKQIVQERTATGQCLCCEHKAERLGLCPSHYWKFRAALLAVPQNERETFRAQLIREGRLLPSRQGQRLDHVNEFRQAR